MPEASVDILLALAVALACGLIVGFERGWRGDAPSAARDAGTLAGTGDRPAGIRTFALTGLLGGLLAVAEPATGGLFLPAVTLVLGALLVAGYMVEIGRVGDAGLTTEIALLLTFVLGVIAGRGQLLPAVAVAVTTATLLGFKDAIHSSLGRLQQKEVKATLQLALAAAVILPLLPDKAMGPWDSLNPRLLGWLILLIAGIGFVGYFAVRLLGARAGLLLTALFGGLTSSTAVSISFARLGRQSPEHAAMLGAGIALACASMGPRVLIEVAAVNSRLLPPLMPGMIILTALPLAAAAFIAWRQPGQSADRPEAKLDLQNPLALRQALLIGLALAAVFVLSRGAQAWLGDRGVYAMAMISGIADVDAVTLAIAEQAKGTLAEDVAARAILIAALVNTGMKAVYAAVIGGLLVARWASSILLVTTLAAAATLPFI